MCDGLVGDETDARHVVVYEDWIGEIATTQSSDRTDARIRSVVYLHRIIITPVNNIRTILTNIL